MGLFDKIKEPIFLKEEGSLTGQLASLEEMLNIAPAAEIKKLEQDIRNMKAGIIGEQQVAFELKNSHIPMYVLHDLNLEFHGLTAQIDFLVITRRRNFVIECKNLYGNMEITDQGDFIRNISYQGKYFKERIYSPITQNQRHLALIKQICMAKRTNIFTKAMFEKNFSLNYRSVVVLANPKTVLNDRYAPREIKDQVIPVDRLITYMEKVNSEKGVEDSSEKEMSSLAHFFLSINKPAPKRNSVPPSGELSHVRVLVSESEPEAEQEEETEMILCSRCGAEMVLRTATRGDNAGNTFYGCSRFPKCRNIVSVK